MFLDEYKPYVQGALDRKLINKKDIDDVLRGTLRVMLKLGLMDSSPDNPYNKIGIDDRKKNHG